MSEQDTFGTFESVVGSLLGNTSGGTDFPIMDPPGLDDEETEEKSEVETGGFKDERTFKEDGVKVEEPEEDEEEVEEEEEPEEKEKEVEEPEEKKKEKSEIADLSELGDAEPEITAYVQEKLYKKFGWEVEDDDKFEKVEDLVDYLEKIVEANSAPEFANNEIQELDKYVREGGNIRDFFNNVYGDFDVDTVNVDSEVNQVRLIQESLKQQGYSSDKIEKRIKRYEDTGTLKDEAIDAQDFLKNNKEETRKKLLSEQSKVQEQVREQQQKFYNDVSSNIESLNDVKGIKISKSDKQKLLDYIFKPDREGKTQYQKDYAKSTKNLIESAFFTMKGDALVKGLARQAESQATKNLKEKLATKTKKGKNNGDYEDESGVTGGRSLDIFASFMKP